MLLFLKHFIENLSTKTAFFFCHFKPEWKHYFKIGSKEVGFLKIVSETMNEGTS